MNENWEFICRKLVEDKKQLCEGIFSTIMEKIACEDKIQRLYKILNYQMYGISEIGVKGPNLYDDFNTYIKDFLSTI